MLKYKAGLHKEVSAIFNGVSLPNDGGAQQPSATPAPVHQESSTPKPPTPELPAPKPLLPETPISKPPAPSHMTPTKPQSEQPPSPPPKEAPIKQPKAKTAIKTAGQPQWQRTLEQIQSKLFPPKPGVDPKKQKIMAVAVPVLFIALIFVFIRLFSSPSQKIAGGAPVPVRTAAASDGKVAWQVPEPYPTTLRDPMQFGPVSYEDGQVDSTGLVVKGIVYSKINPCAVVGDRMVHEGDKVLGAVVVRINEKSVEFEANGKKWTQRVQR